jgi:hypothetical protein
MLNWRPVMGLVRGLDRSVDTKLSIGFNFDRENRKGFSFDREILIGWTIKKRRRGRQLVIAISPRRGRKTGNIIFPKLFETLKYPIISLLLILYRAGRLVRGGKFILVCFLYPT